MRNYNSTERSSLTTAAIIFAHYAIYFRRATTRTAAQKMVSFLLCKAIPLYFCFTISFVCSSFATSK